MATDSIDAGFPWQAIGRPDTLWRVNDRRNVWVLAVTVGAALTAIYAWMRVLPLHLRQLGADETQASWALFCLAVAFRLPQLAGGWIADRLGRKRVAVGATLAMAACYAAIAVAPTWKLVTAAVCTCWAIGAIQWPAMAALAADSVPADRRGRAMGLLESAGMAGMTLGPLLGAWAVGEGRSTEGSWRPLLFATCGVYVVATVVRQVLLREAGPRPLEAERSARTGFGLLSLLLAVHALSFAVYFLTTDGPVLSFYVVDDKIGTAATVQDVYFWGGLAAMAAAFAAGWLADRIGPGRVIVLGSVASAALLAQFVLGPRAPSSDLWLFGLMLVAGEIYFVGYQKLITGAAPPGRAGLYVGLGGTTVGLLASWAMVWAGQLYRVSHVSPMAAAAVVQVAAVVLALPLLAKRFN
jgi:MFS family permease